MVARRGQGKGTLISLTIDHERSLQKGSCTLLLVEPQGSHSPCRRAVDRIETALEAETEKMATLIAPWTGQCVSILSTITETELAGG